MCVLEPSAGVCLLPAYSKYRSHFHHIVLIDQHIRRGGFPSSKSIARELELSDRTIRRNIEFMRDALGAPIEYDPSRKGYCYTQPAWTLPGIQLTEGELLGLVLVQLAVSAYKGTPLESYLKSIVDKLVARLPEEISVDPRGLAESFRITLGPVAPINPEHWEMLARAIREKRSVRMTYYAVGRDKTADRDVDPYLLRCYRGDWYLVAHDHASGYVPIFSLARIRALKLLDEHFVVRDDFHPDEYLGGIFQTVETSERHKVRIQFFDIAARLIAERIWHPTQKLTHRKDGSVVLEMTVADLDEVAWWVLSWGSRARVLAPEALLSAVLGEAAAILESRDHG